MSNTANIEFIPLRQALIGRDTPIVRALPSRQRKMVGAWCFLDHAGPVSFAAGEGLDVGPHPHIGLQTFTWMIDGTVIHSDSLGNEQIISPHQINLMTAGHGITHTEVAPATETRMHAAQLWIALPDSHLHIPPAFEHYPNLPVKDQDNLTYTVLVGDFLGLTSPVQVYTPLMGVDIASTTTASTTLALRPDFEYGVLLLEGSVSINGQELGMEQMMVSATGLSELTIALGDNSRVLLIGGEPFKSPILLWWNFVGRTSEELKTAREQWANHDPRFGDVTNYPGERLEAPTFPHLKESQ